MERPLYISKMDIETAGLDLFLDSNSAVLEDPSLITIDSILNDSKDDVQVRFHSRFQKLSLNRKLQAQPVARF